MAIVEKFLEGLTGEKEKFQAAEEELNVLKDIANGKLLEFENKITDQYRNREVLGKIQVIGNKMSEFSRGYRINYQAGNTSGAVKGIVNEILSIGKADTRKIIADTIANALDAFFPKVGANEDDKRLFRVVGEGYVIVRYDFWVWRRQVRVDGIFTHAKNIVAWVYARGVVDFEQLNKSLLIDAAQQSLGTVNAAALKKYIDDLTSLYDEFSKLNASKRKATIARYNNSLADHGMPRLPI